jgi:Type ISP C-terminal specificity domain
MNMLPGPEPSQTPSRSSQYDTDHVIQYAYRPLDQRWLYWEGKTKLLNEKRADFYEQVFPGNLYLQFIRKQRRAGQFDHGMVLDHFMDLNFADGGARCFPLYERPSGQLFTTQQPNFRDEILAALLAKYGEHHDLVEHLFFHIAALLNSPGYRIANAGAIERNWPRIPIPAVFDTLKASAALGRQVADLLRPDVSFVSPAAFRTLAKPARKDGEQLSEADLKVTVRYSGRGRYEPPVLGPEGKPGRLWWNDVGFWDNVPAEIWSFTIGGYPVIKKWLDYRHIDSLGRPLHLKEMLYVTEMVQRIATLIALGPALDENYLAVKENAIVGLGVSSQAQIEPAFVTAEEEEEK